MKLSRLTKAPHQNPVASHAVAAEDIRAKMAPAADSQLMKTRQTPRNLEEVLA